MDASAYLKKQGWRGDGHSLDHTNRGISKPLLVSKKVDALGVGLNKHATVSDQWWLRAFDLSLKSLGTGEESVLASVQKYGVNRGGLYGRFVKGESNPGSIGQSPQDTTGANTPVEPIQNTDTTMAIDIPPPDKLERVVGNAPDKNSHDAMMHMLQNPHDAPAGMRKMLDRKRKRAERPVEKRARRKIDRQQRYKEEAEKRRLEAKEVGTWDPEKEEEYRHMKDINRRANEFVLDAQKRGIIPLGPNETRKGIVPIPSGANAEAIMPDKLRDGMQQVFDQVGLNTQVKFKGSGKNSLKAQKYAREKMKRELKRAAKAYLLGEKPPHEQTREEKKAKKAKKALLTAQKKADAAKKDAERMAGREERAARKREQRMKKAAEKAEIEKIMEERDAALKPGKTVQEYYAERAEREAAAASEATTDSSGSSEEAESAPNGESNGNEFDSGKDEVKFGMNSKGGRKKIPGVGVVDRYPTKAEKKAKKLKAMAIKERISDEEMQARLDAGVQDKLAVERAKVDAYRAMKHGMSLDQYRTALEKGDVHTPAVEKKNIDPEKLAEYKERAAEKGLRLEEYIKRREEKHAVKQADKLGNPFQQDIMNAAMGGADFIPAPPEQPAAESNDVGFIIDTEGDEKLGKKYNSAKANMSQGKPLAIVDTAGDEAYTYAPNMPVPLDPRIWEGKLVKDLPKPVRKARREWMAQRREAKKARANANQDKPMSQKKTKGARKIAAREAFVKQVLFQSRRALREGAGGSGMVTIDGVENVPLVKIESREGTFKKGEVSLARTVARRVLRTVKREEKAKMGKGKGWKKRERAAKEAARNAGISGFTDKARLDPTAKTNKDLLL